MQASMAVAHDAARIDRLTGGVGMQDTPKQQFIE
jgi:hypothetical protein